MRLPLGALREWYTTIRCLSLRSAPPAAHYGNRRCQEYAFLRPRSHQFACTYFCCCSLWTAMSRSNVHTRFGSPGSPNRPKRRRASRDHLPHGRCSARARRMCRWCSHDSGNLGESNTCTLFAGHQCRPGKGVFRRYHSRAEQGGKCGCCHERFNPHDAVAAQAPPVSELRTHKRSHGTGSCCAMHAEHDPFRQKKAYEAALFRNTAHSTLF